jgi:hypothetical protein
MHNSIPTQSAQPLAFPRVKPLGSYLVDAGLLSGDQIKVILADQQATGMRFGEIAVARGWVKEQTVEWIIRKVIEPERKALQQRLAQSTPPTQPLASETTLRQDTTVKQPFIRRDLPISKPLPSVKSSDSDVNWVG